MGIRTDAVESIRSVPEASPFRVNDGRPDSLEGAFMTPEKRTAINEYASIAWLFHARQRGYRGKGKKVRYVELRSYEREKRNRDSVGSNLLPSPDCPNRTCVE
jgi:hypothetical protein